MVLTTFFQCSEIIYIDNVILSQCQRQQQNPKQKVNIKLVLGCVCLSLPTSSPKSNSKSFSPFTLSSDAGSCCKAIKSNSISKKEEKLTLQMYASYHVETTLNACTFIHFILAATSAASCFWCLWARLSLRRRLIHCD